MPWINISRQTVIKPNAIKYSAIVVLIALIIVSCAATNDQWLRDDAPTIKAVYDQKFGVDPARDKTAFKRGVDASELNSTVQHGISDFTTRFQYLPNPTLVMYIYPHLTDAGRPVPGYATFFTFYERDPVALESELTENNLKRHHKKSDESHPKNNHKKNHENDSNNNNKRNQP